jgi:hypothetical protein
VSSPLWFGSGFHFALEDFHGHNVHGGPFNAFNEYVSMFKPADRPADWEELIVLAEGMFRHYANWRKNRDTFNTVWVAKNPGEEPRPLVEVEFRIPLPESLVGRPNVFYAGTMDRIVCDEYGDFWILDYKTAAQFDTSKLEMDPQVSAYCWAAKTIFDLPIQGMVFMQFKKSFPHPPKLLKSTNGFSLDKSQNTTFELYKRAIDSVYGDGWEECPKELRGKYHEFLDYLLGQETENGDKFIRFDLVRRNEFHLQSVYEQIIEEVVEMLKPDLPLYPNPTSNCVWDCPFVAPCMAKDDGGDWEYLLFENYERQDDRTPWRNTNTPSDPYVKAEN